MIDQTIKRLLLIFFLFVIPCSTAIAFEEEWGEKTGAVEQPEKQGFKPGRWFVSLYRNHISAVDGDRCPSLPSCSSYSFNAMKKHGFLIGWIMTVDRLIHEGREEAEVTPRRLSENALFPQLCVILKK